jgi:hypothetical protein
VRLRLLLPIVAIAVLAAAGSGVVAHATTRDDRESAAAAAVVNLKSAIAQETYARHAVQEGLFNDALTALHRSKAALDDVETGATKILHSDPAWMNDPGWKKLQTDSEKAAFYYDPYAMLAIRERRGENWIAGYINGALQAKDKALQAANALAKPPCVQVINLQGPITVNGVAQGEPQLTISLSCKVVIATLKIETPGQTVDSCSDPGHQCTIANSSDVTVQAGGSKDPSVTIQGSTLADGEEVIVDVVPIAGDSSSYISDDVM